MELEGQNRIENAIGAYDEVAYSSRGRAYGRLGQLERKIQDYDEAIRLDPQLALGYSNRGAAYSGLSQLKRAIEGLDEAIRLDPQVASAYANRAMAYTLLGKDKAA